jgi:hypothetical protein
MVFFPHGFYTPLDKGIALYYGCRLHACTKKQAQQQQECREAMCYFLWHVAMF